MLNKSPLMVDIDLKHWQHLQTLFLDSAKAKRRIVIIHENGEILKFVHSQRLDIVKNVKKVDDPRRVAEKVFNANRDNADFVLVFERKAFDRYTADFQDSWSPQDDIDVFVRRQFDMTGKYGDGIVTYPRPAQETLGLQWRLGSSYQEVAAAVKKYVPPNTSVVLGVFEGGSLWATLVLHFNAEHSMDVVTTVDMTEFQEARGDMQSTIKLIVSWVERHYAPCSLGLFTDMESARRIIASKDNKGIFSEIVASGKLIMNPAGKRN